MQKILGLSLLMIGASVNCLAGNSIPEIDPAAGGAVIALVAGGLLVIRGRRKR